MTYKDFSPSMEAAGCFLEFDKKILYLKRASTREEGNAWCIPGGKLEKGETPLDATLREVLEEVGVRLDKESLSFVGTLSMRIPARDYLFHMFHCTCKALPQIQLKLDEHSDFLWTPLEEIETLPLIRGGPPALQIYQNWRKKYSL